MADAFKHVLVVDDDIAMRDSLNQLLQAAGWSVALSDSGQAAIKFQDLAKIAVVLTDVRMPGLSGLDLMAELNKRPHAPPVVLISAHGDISMAVDAIRKGAYSFVEKPFDPHQLLRTLNNAAEQYQLRGEARRLKQRLSEMAGLERALPGSSEAIVALREELSTFQLSSAPLLLIGETGTGKKLVARACYDMRAQVDSVFVTVPCTGLSDETLRNQEQELETLKKKGGTLLLNQINACPQEMQPRLARLIEPIIDSSTGNRTVSIVSTTEQDLRLLIEASQFSAELYFMISTVVLTIPPLRDRPSDISALHLQFLAVLCEIYQLDIPLPTAEDTTRLLSHDWPGNVRELRNIAERQVLGARRGDPSVATALAVDTETANVPPTLRGAVAALERELIAQAIKANRGKMDATAEALGIGRRTLNEKIVKLGLDKSALL